MKTPQAKKLFYDWLDRSRPWAQPGVDCYAMMEEMVNQTARIFNGERIPTVDEVQKLETVVLGFTESLSDHPANYDGPCLCAECRSNA